MGGKRAAWLAMGFALLVAGCAVVDIDKLVPTTAVDWVTPGDQPIVINRCSEATKTRILTGPLSYSAVSQNTAALNSVLPDAIRRDPIVQAVMVHAQYIAAQSTNIAGYVAQAGDTSGLSPTVPSPKISLAPQHFEGFARMVSESVLRHTPSTPSASGDAGPNASDLFWTKVKAYYKAYFDGSFITYFGSTYDQPKVSTTIGDTEIVQAASVFLELIMDEIFHSPVWKGSSDGKYYPGGNKNKPTVLTVNSVTPESISEQVYGCGMNVPKANTVLYLSTAFTKAAEAESNLTIKSVGGVEIGLGVLGKVSIGDNSTLTNLVQALVSEIVGRLTVALAVPVLSAIDIEQQPALKSQSSAVAQPTAKAIKANQIRVLSTPFVSATAR
jgi:hypothetical protein